MEEMSAWRNGEHNKPRGEKKYFEDFLGGCCSWMMLPPWGLPHSIVPGGQKTPLRHGIGHTEITGVPTATNDEGTHRHRHRTLVTWHIEHRITWIAWPRGFWNQLSFIALRSLTKYPINRFVTISIEIWFLRYTWRSAAPLGMEHITCQNCLYTSAGLNQPQSHETQQEQGLDTLWLITDRHSINDPSITCQ